MSNIPLFLESYDIDLEAIMRIIPGNVYIKDIKGRYLWCNSDNAKWLRLSIEEIIGKTDYDFLSKVEADMLRRVDMEVMAKKKTVTVEEPGTDENGKTIFYLSKKSPLFDKAGQLIGIIGNSFDLSQKRKELDNLKNTQSQTDKTLHEIIALMPGHIYWKDAKGRFLGCNDLQAKSVGYTSAKDLIGKTAYDTLEKKQADIITQTDSLIMKEDKPYVIEEVSNTYDGKEAVYLSQKIPLHDIAGKVIGILGVSLDITEQKKIQDTLKRYQGQIDGMTLVSASVAHELRTPLASIRAGVKGISDLFPRLLDAYRKAKQHGLDVMPISEKVLDFAQNSLERVDDSAKQAHQVIDMILMSISTNENNLQRTDFCSVKHCIDEALSEYSFQPGKAELVKLKEINDFNFYGSEMLIKHVIFNLLRNALYFIEKSGKGEIFIWTSQEESYNKLHFKDTGQGIPEKSLPKIFDRFFTEGTHRGTGVGLSFCKMVMASLGGKIECNSQFKEYAEFILFFPTVN